MMIKSVYVHIPFCKSFCTYCDFARELAPEKKAEGYFAAVATEIAQFDRPLRAVETLYWGGGTPSCVAPRYLLALKRALAKRIDFAKLKEFTIEVNPADVTPEFIACLKQLAPTRISLGIQSFAEKKLRLLNRRHTRAGALAAVKALQRAGFTNLSFDLIYGFAGDSWRTFRRDLKAALRLNPMHLSLYDLILEPGSALGRRAARGEQTCCSERTTIKIFEKSSRFLTKRGFSHYEIASFARPGYTAKHNENYWNGSFYVGFGAGAASYYDKMRMTNWATVAGYIASQTTGTPEARIDEVLTEADMMAEAVMLGLRTAAGIDGTRFFEAFGKTPEAVYPVLTDLATRGLLEQRGADFIIPEGKLIISSAIIKAILGW